MDDNVHSYYYKKRYHTVGECWNSAKVAKCIVDRDRVDADLRIILSRHRQVSLRS